MTRTLKGREIDKASLVYEVFTDAPAKDADGYSASHAGAGAASTVNMTLGGALTSGGIGNAGIYARNVVIIVTHATSVVAMSGTIYGTDKNGEAITETWSVTATGTSKTYTGSKAFKTVTQITETVAADASANSIVAGTGDKLRLSARCSVASLVKETSGGSVVTNGTLVAGVTGSATADARGTYAPNTVPDGSTDYEIWYISNNPEGYK
jgi:hypothetical protein